MREIVYEAYMREIVTCFYSLLLHRKHFESKALKHKREIDIDPS